MTYDEWKLTPAAKYFDAWSKSMLLEEEVSDALLEAAGIDSDKPKEWPIDDITFDDYDTSFEFKKVNIGWEPPKGTLEKWWALGFARCWICYTDGSEKYYHAEIVDA